MILELGGLPMLGQVSWCLPVAVRVRAGHTDETVMTEGLRDL